MRRLLLVLIMAVPAPLLAQEEGAASSLGGSAAARQNKSWGLGLGGGAFLAPVNGAGLQGFYALNGSAQVELQLWSGTWDATDLLDATSTVKLQKFDVNARQTQIRLKYFVGNSFYLAGGLGTRSIEFDLEASDSTSTRLTGNLKSNATILNLAIGNTWTFDSGFFIGAEWLAAAVPMGASFSTDFTMTGPNSTDITGVEEDAKKAAKDLGEITTMGLITLHLGFQF